MHKNGMIRNPRLILFCESPQSSTCIYKWLKFEPILRIKSVIHLKQSKKKNHEVFFNIFRHLAGHHFECRSQRKPVAKWHPSQHELRRPEWTYSVSTARLVADNSNCWKCWQETCSWSQENTWTDLLRNLSIICYNL